MLPDHIWHSAKDLAKTLGISKEGARRRIDKLRDDFLEEKEVIQSTWIEFTGTLLLKKSKAGTHHFAGSKKNSATAPVQPVSCPGQFGPSLAVERRF